MTVLKNLDTIYGKITDKMATLAYWLSRIPESRMMSSTATRLNIPVTHSRKSWMENTRTIGSLSRDPVLVSNEINKIDKRIK